MSKPNKPNQEAPTGPVSNPELEIKDAQLIFHQVWRRLEQDYGREKLRFPHEIMWLGGAPGAGKGTNTPFIMRERGLTAAPIVMSDLLNTPEMKALKDRGHLVGDREAIDVLLRHLLAPQFESGVVVDGFPRTSVQVQAVKLLHDHMMELHTEFFHTPSARYFRRPLFRITVLFVDEHTSIQRQMHRGREIQENNERVQKGEEGTLMGLRPTDVDEEMARNRYRTFKEQTYDALTSLRTHFHYHFINAQVPLEQVEKNIMAEFKYQSSLELAHATYNRIHNLPVVSEVIVHARQELVRRLDQYEEEKNDLFGQVVAWIDCRAVPSIRRHAIAGRARLTSDNPMFSNPAAVDMVIDVLSERGFRVVYTREIIRVPDKFDLQTGQIHASVSVLHLFDISFQRPRIRSGY